MNPDEEEQQDELEVTGEGTAGGPFGLKKVLFVRKKSEKGGMMASKEVNAAFICLLTLVSVHSSSPSPGR